MCFPDFQIDNLDSGLVLREIFFNFLDCLKCTDFEILSFYFFFLASFSERRGKTSFFFPGFSQYRLAVISQKGEINFAFIQYQLSAMAAQHIVVCITSWESSRVVSPATPFCDRVFWSFLSHQEEISSHVIFTLIFTSSKWWWKSHIIILYSSWNVRNGVR